MKQRIGQLLTVIGVVMVILPIAGALTAPVTGYEVPWVLDRVPSLVLYGIFCFVLGIGLRELA